MNRADFDSDLGRDGWKERSLPGFFGLVAPLWTRKEEASWAYGFIAQSQHLNRAGIVHGGMLTTLMDHALSAIAWEDAQRRACVTTALDMHFIGPVREGMFVEARGRVIGRTRTLLFLQGVLTVSDGEVAAASAVMKILEPR